MLAPIALMLSVGRLVRRLRGSRPARRAYFLKDRTNEYYRSSVVGDMRWRTLASLRTGLIEVPIGPALANTFADLKKPPVRIEPTTYVYEAHALQIDLRRRILDKSCWW